MRAFDTLATHLFKLLAVFQMVGLCFDDVHVGYWAWIRGASPGRGEIAGHAHVFCENVDGGHVLPGGRRHPGETHADTVTREVHEETGWLLDRESLRPLGWLHFEHLAPRRPDHLYPYPDFLQVVFHGTATERAGGSDWTDTDGYELRSRLVSVAEARRTSLNGPLATTFLDLL